MSYLSIDPRKGTWQSSVVFPTHFNPNSSLLCEVLYEIIHICTAVVDESEE